MTTKPMIGQAFGILATAFLASMAVSSFFFIKPGDARADNSICQSQGILTNGIDESTILLTVNLSKGCYDTPMGILRGVDERGIAHFIAQTETYSIDNGYETKSEIDLNLGFKYYTFEIGNYFYAEVSSR